MKKQKSCKVKKSHHVLFGVVFEVWVDGKYIGIEKTRAAANNRAQKEASK